MKKLFISFLVFSLATESFAATPVLLKPSLQAQMKLQETQDKKAANITRLAELRAKRLATKTPASTSTQAKTKTITSAKTSTVTPNKVTLQPTIHLTNQPSISGVDMNRVRSTWIGWYNDVRATMGLKLYSYDSRLDATAYDWNKVFASGKGQNHHKRNPGDAYYDYPTITEWFRERGVVGKVVNGATTTENVGWGTYSCSSNDCTSALLASIRTTFDFFMSEKSYNGAHYRSVVSSAFTKIGLSVIVVPSERRYYLTVHYITE